MPARLRALPSVVVVTGHYGVGKTNFALNLAHDFAALGVQVCLADLDVVNPYFRSSDYASSLASDSIELIAPVLAGTALDSPSISGRVSTAIDVARAAGPLERICILDAGGDDAGATVLARFAPQIASGHYAMLHVVNAYRNLTPAPEDAMEVLREIENKSHLRVTAIVNNSHLQNLTDRFVVEQARAFGCDVALLAGVPLACTTMPIDTVRQTSGEAFNAVCDDEVYYVRRYVKTPWEE